MMLMTLNDISKVNSTIKLKIIVEALEINLEI